ncbi:MAG: ABC transporter permease [Ekhidna sp.]
MANRKSPPQAIVKLMERLFRSDRLDEISGDLIETYHDDIQHMPKWKARWYFIAGFLFFLKPSNHKAMTNTTLMLIRNYLKIGFRSLKKNKAYSTLNILGLAMGLAVVFTTMAWVNYHSSFDQFHEDHANTYEVMLNNYSSDGEIQTYSGGVNSVMHQAKASIPEITSLTQTFDNWRWPSEQCFKIDEDKECIYSKGVFSDSAFFEVFDFKILSGDKSPLKDPKSIVLTETLAKKLYGDENPVGKTYKVGNYYEVIVTAIIEDIPTESSLQFTFVAPFELLYSMWGTKAEQYTENSFTTYVSLSSPDVEKVEGAINAISSSHEDISHFLHPLDKVHLYDKFENGKSVGGLIDYVRIFGLFAIFTLIMSMVNFINLTTAQAGIRGKEIGIRKVIGANKSILSFQFFFEIFLKVCFASLIAFVVVIYSLPLINSMIGETIVITFSMELLLQVLAIIMITTLLSGIYPVMILSRFEPMEVLKNLQFKGGGKKTIRKWLATIQIGISGVIVILTTVIYLQFNYLKNKDIGYDREGILIMEPTWEHVKNYKSFSNELLKYPQIKSVGTSNANMVDAQGETDNVSWQGKIEGENLLFKQIGADKGILDVFNIEIVEGSSFYGPDTLEQVILTEGAVKQMNFEDPIGKYITQNGQERKVVGVAKDFFSESLHKSILPTLLYKVAPRYAGTIYIRYDKDYPKESLEIINSQYNKFEKRLNMKYSFLDENYQEHYQSEQVISKLSFIVVILTIFIAIIGILGLSAFNVVRRYKEIGLRKIFGASVPQIITILSKEFVRITLVSSFITLPVALYLADYWLSNFAYRIPTPYTIFGATFFLTLAIIVVLVSLQSIKVANLNPTKVVRNE